MKVYHYNKEGMVDITPNEAYEKKRQYFEAMAVMTAEEKKLQSTNFLATYIWSLLLPPIGLYFFVKYVFFGDGEPNRRRAGVIALVITIISAVLSLWVTSLLFSSVTATSGDSGSVPRLLQPENQKSLIDLYK